MGILLSYIWNFMFARMMEDDDGMEIWNDSTTINVHILTTVSATKRNVPNSNGNSTFIILTIVLHVYVFLISMGFKDGFWGFCQGFRATSGPTNSTFCYDFHDSTYTVKNEEVEQEESTVGCKSQKGIVIPPSVIVQEDFLLHLDTVVDDIHISHFWLQGYEKFSLVLRLSKREWQCIKEVDETQKIGRILYTLTLVNCTPEFLAGFTIHTV